MTTIDPNTGEVYDGPRFVDENLPEYADPVELLTEALVRWARIAQIFITGACIAVLIIMVIVYPVATIIALVAALLVRRWARKGQDQR